jgi:hypothetical protein
MGRQADCDSMTDVDCEIAQAIELGENALKQAIRGYRSMLETVSGVVHARNVDDELSAELAQQMRRLKRVESYGLLALTQLPSEPIERLVALLNHTESLQFFADAV